MKKKVKNDRVCQSCPYTTKDVLTFDFRVIKYVLIWPGTLNLAISTVRRRSL